jgi:hypothetical protein
VLILYAKIMPMDITNISEELPASMFRTKQDAMQQVDARYVIFRLDDATIFSVL